MEYTRKYKWKVMKSGKTIFITSKLIEKKFIAIFPAVPARTDMESSENMD
jgi:hypothetical protein